MPDNNFYTWEGGWLHSLGLKRAPDKYNYSRPRFGHFESDGIATGSYYPNRALPVRFKDNTTERGVVIPIASIVAMKSLIPPPAGTTTPGAIGQLEEYGIDENGQIALGRNWDGSVASVRDANGFFGYQEELEGLITLANGGAADITDQYSDLDVILGKVNPGVNPTTGLYNLTFQGNLVASGNLTPLRLANKPAGVVTQDVWDDIRGRHLNYNQPTQEGVSVRRIGRFKVPFVIGDTFNMQPSELLTTNIAFPATSVGYAAVRDLFQFIVLPATVLTGSVRLENSFVIPDRLGKFKLFGYNDNLTAWSPATAAELMARNEQKVGRFQMIDHRFPKSLIEYVDTYPGSHTAGTDTAGLTQELFTFILLIYAANNGGALPTRVQALNMVKQGLFGYAYIQVEV